MSTKRQLFDVLVAGALAVVVTILGNMLSPGLGSVFGILLACAWYFSRYPWGSRSGQRVNERIDAFYDQYLPI